LSGERGSAPVESTLALVFILLLSLGVIEVALALYARNVVLASAHEGARAAAEIGRDESEAAAIAADTIRRSTGNLVRDLRVAVSVNDAGTSSTIRVLVTGVVDAPGPVPFPLPIRATAGATTSGLPR